MRGVASVLAGLLLVPGLASQQPSGSEPKVRGIVISTHTDGREWGSDAIDSTIDSIREVGAGWISTHPYAAVRDDGSVRFRDFDPASPPESLLRPIREAHRRGLRIMVKPHLAYWGSPFRWRGEIAFEEPRQWDRFFRQYEDWIVKLATVCREADGFVVGTELGRTLGHERAWRRLIERVRAATGAALTYAANWDHYREVPFWDAVDAIGIQAYFPLSDRPHPDRAELTRAWGRRMAELREFGRRRNRRIVFTELGYNRSYAAASSPWNAPGDGPEAEDFQALCLEVALRAVESEPAVVGVFLWKWFPDPYPVGGDYQLATPRIKQVIRDAWIRRP